MKKFTTSFFAALGTNMLILFLHFAFPGFAFFLLFTLPIGFFVGLLLVFYPRYREMGAGFIVASGVSMLIAGFVCSNTSFL